MTELETFCDDRRWGALERHMREAIHINTARMSCYSKLSGGKTLQFSRRLIRSEKLSAIFARPVDWYARRFQKQGIPIVTEDYVSMHLVPQFRPSLEASERPRLADFRRPKSEDLSSQLWSAQRAGLQECVPLLQCEIESVRQPKVFLSLYRHLLESMLRIANLSTQHAVLARERGAPEPEGFSKFLFVSHLPLLREAVQMDSEVASIQADGIPFLYQDMPPIAPSSDFYMSLRRDA